MSINFPLHRRRVLAAVSGGALACTGLAASASTRLAIGGTGAALGTIRLLAEAFAAKHAGIQLDLPSSLGTTGGMRAVLSGAIDIAVGVRAVTAEESAAGARSQLFARSPFAFVTSHPNPPTDLTRDDIAEIYGLRRRSWPDGSPIRVVLRTRRDGDSLFIIERFPATEAEMDATHAKKTVPVAQTDQINLDMAEKLQGSFTSSTLAAVVSEGRKLRSLTLDGVQPTLEATASGAYPHVRPLHFVTMPSTSEAGHAFIAFVRSARGASLLAECAALPANG